jgi:DNA-directed RNA polymerase specialized sigma24 family protein
MRLLQHLERHGRTSADLRPLMNTIAKNLIVERFRTGGREIAIDIDDGVLKDARDVLQDVVRRDETETLAEALNGLPTAEQQTAVRMWLHGLKPREIADELGL